MVIGKQFQNREVTKLYLALVDSYGEKPESYMDLRFPLNHCNVYNITHVDLKNGKEARTECVVLEHQENLTLILAKIHTGRTHQIRAHLAASGFPIHGDLKYNPNANLFEQLLLHSSLLRLRTLGRDYMTFVSLPVWIPDSRSIEEKLIHFSARENLA
jgi:23S rRNA pseudouridine1911/1915/1917 synthase